MWIRANDGLDLRRLVVIVTGLAALVAGADLSLVWLAGLLLVLRDTRTLRAARRLRAGDPPASEQIPPA